MYKFVFYIGVDLSVSFSTEALLPLLSDKDTQSRLKPFLPVVDSLPESENELRETIQSPQFKQVRFICHHFALIYDHVCNCSFMNYLLE